MKKGNLSRINILQLLVLLAIVIYIGVLLLSERDSSTSFSDVRKAVLQAVGKEAGMQEAKSSVWKRYYGLSPKDYEGAMLLYTEGVMEVEEVLLVKAEDDSQAQEVEKAIRKRLKTQKTNFEGYGVEQTKLLKNAVVERKGTYIFMAVSEHAGKYDKAFKESL